MQLLKAAGLGKAPASPAAGPADGPAAPDDLLKVCPACMQSVFRMKECTQPMLCSLQGSPVQPGAFTPKECLQQRHSAS
jgi:hypothetical protein